MHNSVFVFWQDVVSLHQYSFIVELAGRGNNKVILLVQQHYDIGRQSQGWGEDIILNDVELIVNPDKNQIQEYAGIDAVHILSGIGFVPLVNSVLEIISSNNIWVLSENFRQDDILAPIRLCRARRLFRKFDIKIKGYLAIGNFKEQLLSWGIAESKVHMFGYWSPNISIPQVNTIDRDIDVIFVGRLVMLKNIFLLLRLILRLKKYCLKVVIIGDGPLRLFMSTSKYLNFKWIPSIPNTEIYKYMQRSKLLILPSKYDGWGYVINEAIVSQCAVLTSEQVGSGSYLRGNRGVSVLSLKLKKQKWIDEILYMVLSHSNLEIDTSLLAASRGCDIFLNAVNQKNKVCAE